VLGSTAIMGRLFELWRKAVHAMRCYAGCWIGQQNRPAPAALGSNRQADGRWREVDEEERERGTKCNASVMAFPGLSAHARM